MIEMFVTGVALDIRSNVPLVILNDAEREYTLPIWIGQAEAQAIAKGLEGIETPRPMTHDLMVEMIDALDATVESIEINSFEETTFFASIILVDSNENTSSIDARPSDAIALALRVEAPIFVAESILNDVAANLEVLTEEEHKKRVEKESSEDEEEDFELDIHLEEELLDGKPAPISREEFREFLKYVKASDFTLKESE